jgi:hypothetical protein
MKACLTYRPVATSMSHIHVSVNKQSTRQNTLLHALTPESTCFVR